jgi:hypothetical protein
MVQSVSGSEDITRVLEEALATDPALLVVDETLENAPGSSEAA